MPDDRASLEAHPRPANRANPPIVSVSPAGVRLVLEDGCHHPAVTLFLR